MCDVASASRCCELNVEICENIFYFIRGALTLIEVPPSVFSVVPICDTPRIEANHVIRKRGIRVRVSCCASYPFRRRSQVFRKNFSPSVIMWILVYNTVAGGKRHIEPTRGYICERPGIILNNYFLNRLPTLVAVVRNRKNFISGFKIGILGKTCRSYGTSSGISAFVVPVNEEKFGIRGEKALNLGEISWSNWRMRVPDAKVSEMEENICVGDGG